MLTTFHAHSTAQAEEGPLQPKSDTQGASAAETKAREPSPADAELAKENRNPQLKSPLTSESAVSPVRDIEWYKAIAARERTLRQLAEDRAQQEQRLTSQTDKIESAIAACEALVSSIMVDTVGKRNAFDAIMSGFSPINDQSSTASSTSDSAYGLNIDGLKFKLWDTFQEEQHTFITSNADLLRSRGLVTINGVLLNSDTKCVHEETIQRALDRLFEILNAVGNQRVKTTRASEAACTPCPKADGVSCLGTSPLQALVLKCRRLNLDHHQLLEDLDQFLKAISKRRDVHDAFRQLLGYLQFLGLRFGILTTGNKFWALRWIDSVVEVTPMYRIQAGGACSVLSMMLYVLYLAEQALAQRSLFTRPILKYRDGSEGGLGKEPSGGQDPDSRGKGPAGSEGEGGPSVDKGASGSHGGNKQSCSANSADKENVPPAAAMAGAGASICPYSLLKPLADREDRIVWMVQPEGSARAALVKAFRSAADRDREAAIYRRLRSLQGAGLPVLVAARCLPPLRCDERRHALMLSWVGPERRLDFSPLSRAELLGAKAVLRAVHGLGVAHGDVWPRNLVRGGRAGEVCVVDFGGARTRAEMGRAAFGAECRREMEAMDALIRAAGGAGLEEGHAPATSGPLERLLS